MGSMKLVSLTCKFFEKKFSFPSTTLFTSIHLMRFFVILSIFCSLKVMTRAAHDVHPCTNTVFPELGRERCIYARFRSEGSAYDIPEHTDQEAVLSTLLFDSVLNYSDDSDDEMAMIEDGRIHTSFYIPISCPFYVNLPTSVSDDHRSVIGLGYHSRIAQNYRAVVIGPRKLYTMLCRQSISRFCHPESPLTLVTTYGNVDSWAVRASVSIGSDSPLSNTAESFAIDTQATGTVVSNASYEELIEQIQAIGGQIESVEYPTETRIRVANCATLIDQFPSITISIYSGSESIPAVNLVIDPREYFPDISACMLTIRGETVPPRAGATTRRIGEDVLRNINVGLIRDPPSIGFCDPRDEDL